MSEIRPKMPTPSRKRRITAIVVGLLLVWALVAYLLMPDWWKHYEHRHPGLDAIPGITQTGNGIPGDPLNVALIGDKADLVVIMSAAKWYPADPLSLKSCLEIAEASVLSRPYDNAPVSSLYLFGRKEDLAFEQPVGDNPRHRHHVRFWKLDKPDTTGRPIWVGSAVYDERVGLSHTTGQITHVTARDVDKERNYLFQTLKATGRLVDIQVIVGFHKVLSGKNGGGDPWSTDGNLDLGIIQPVKAAK